MDLRFLLLGLLLYLARVYKGLGYAIMTGLAIWFGWVARSCYLRSGIGKNRYLISDEWDRDCRWRQTKVHRSNAIQVINKPCLFSISESVSIISFYKVCG